MKLERFTRGKHNDVEFRYEGGFLQIFGRAWDKDDIKTLVEVANLLELEGYKIKKVVRYERKEVEGMFGFRSVNSPIYDDEE